MKQTRQRKTCRICRKRLQPADKRDGRCQDCYEEAERRRMRSHEPQPMDKGYAELRTAWSRWKQERAT